MAQANAQVKTQVKAQVISRRAVGVVRFVIVGRSNEVVTGREWCWRNRWQWHKRGAETEGRERGLGVGLDALCLSKRGYGRLIAWNAAGQLRTGGSSEGWSWCSHRNQDDRVLAGKHRREGPIDGTGRM